MHGQEEENAVAERVLGKGYRSDLATKWLNWFLLVEKKKKDLLNSSEVTSNSKVP